MLFVSRHVGLYGFAVVDTETGNERVFDPNTENLYTSIRDAGIEITGVTFGEGAYRIDNVGVSPWQDPCTKSGMQIRQLLFNGVDTTCYNDMLTSVGLNRFRGEDVRMRVSDFCTSIGGFIFRGNIGIATGSLTLVLDDKVKSYDEYAFSSLFQEDVDHIFIDIQAVENMDIVRNAYLSLKQGVWFDWHDAVDLFIKDRIERKKSVLEFIASR